MSVRCPKCGEASSVKDSRPATESNMVRRRRSCNVCEHEWGTYEFNVEDLIDLMELFSRLDGKMADTFGRNAIQRTKEYRSRKRREARNAIK
mgnify:CR=1 FL=1